MIDRPLAISMYKKGTSLREIGEVFGVSKQRVNQVLRMESVDKQRNFTKGKSFGAGEAYVSAILRDGGLKNMITPYGSDYSILAVNGARISVKHRTKPVVFIENGKVYGAYKFLYLPKDYDYAVFLIGDLNKDPQVFVLRSSEMGRSFSFSADPKNKNERLEAAGGAWDRIFSHIDTDR